MLFTWLREKRKTPGIERIKTTRPLLKKEAGKNQPALPTALGDSFPETSASPQLNTATGTWGACGNHHGQKNSHNITETKKS